MKKGSLNFFELHVEKIVLGLCGAFALFMAWSFLINTPNEVEYNGQKVTPDKLDDAVLAAATNLESRVRSAKPKDVAITKYSQSIKAQHEAGLGLGLASKPDDPPALPAALRRATAFGAKIEIPGLKEDEESTASVAVVTPLKPDQPVVETGRSLVVRKQASLTADEPVVTPVAGDDKKPKKDASEIAWVSVAAYVDKKAQQTEMTAAGYAPYRSRVYLVGLDAQRQEILASGDWSEWKDVDPGKAMPKIQIPDPVFDDNNPGVVINKSDIDAAFTLVKANQAKILQPGFFTVEAGDKWVTPPLEGMTHEDESDDEPVKKPKKKEKESQVARQGSPRQPSVPTVGGARTPGGAAVGRTSRGGFTPPPVNTGAKEKAEMAKQADEAIKDAKEAMRGKKYSEAMQHAQQAMGNPEAKDSVKKQAEALMKEAEEAMKKEQPSGGPMVSPGGNSRMPGGMPVMPGMRPGMGVTMPTAQQQEAALVTNPETNQPAAWVHDDSVESGKTYRYRVRAKLWNRYVGQLKAVKNPADAKKTVLLGEWSLPSDAVTVTPSTYFFVKGPKGQSAANVEVWKWREGDWKKENFEVAIGDTVGAAKKIKLDESGDSKSERVEVDFSTGAVVLDLRTENVKVRTAAGKEGQFNTREVPSLVMVYIDPADGRVKERVAVYDKDDPIRKKLNPGEG